MHQKAMCMIANRLLNKTLFQHSTMQSTNGSNKKRHCSSKSTGSTSWWTCPVKIWLFHTADPVVPSWVPEAWQLTTRSFLYLDDVELMLFRCIADAGFMDAGLTKNSGLSAYCGWNMDGDDFMFVALSMAISGTDLLEVPTTYKAYFWGLIFKIWPKLWYSTSMSGCWNSHWM